MVGKSYPPGFYSWIKNPKTRSIFERIAIETEEDYQSLIKILEKFNVKVLRPDILDDIEPNVPLGNGRYAYPTPPMTPRDYTCMFGSDFYCGSESIERFYNSIKDPSWQQGVKTLGDMKNLPSPIQDEINNIHWHNYYAYADIISNDATYKDDSYMSAHADIHENTRSFIVTDAPHESIISSATTVRIGTDIYCNTINSRTISEECKTHPEIFEKYRVHHLNSNEHLDSVFCPVVPGLIISLHDIPTYKDTFPDWEVVYLPDQSWDKVKPFLDLKNRNKGKWWIHGEEYNDDVIEVVDTWMSKWIGYVEETVFDVNMLVINEKNVVVNNYNKAVFDALERYGVTPHICNFRHRYFWDGGLHCITSDLDREGEMKDYFPERG
jgi:N-dimethylarginine dimethylaminohydrolase